MVRPIALLGLLLPLVGCATPAVDGKPETTVLLQTTHAWDGTSYQSYPIGQPQLTLLKILIPPHTTLDWHQHPMPSAGYLLSGELLVDTHDEKHLTLLKAGDALAETVGRIHRGRTGERAAELIVFYAGNTTLPLSQSNSDQASAPYVSPRREPFE